MARFRRFVSAALFVSIFGTTLVVLLNYSHFQTPDSRYLLNESAKREVSISEIEQNTQNRRTANAANGFELNHIFENGSKIISSSSFGDGLFFPVGSFSAAAIDHPSSEPTIVPTSTSNPSPTASPSTDSNLPSATPSTKPSKEKKSGPNVIIITTDQQRFDALSFVQDELSYYKGKCKVRTPNLEKLAKSGVYFRNAYTQCPSCAPARLTLRTGCTVERTGMQSNYLVEPEIYELNSMFVDKFKALKTYDQILVEQMGYASDCFGKFHLPSMFYYGSENKKSNVISYDNYNYKTERFEFDPKDGSARNYKQNVAYLSIKNKLKRRDFKAGQQKDTRSNFPYTPIALDSRYGKPTDTPLRGNDDLDGFDGSNTGIYGFGTLASEYSDTAMYADAAKRAIERFTAEKQKFCLTISFNAPHPPTITSPEYAKYYWKQRKKMFVTPSLDDEMLNSQYKGSIVRQQLKESKSGYGNPSRNQEWTALYYGLVEEVDTYMGEIMETLKRNSQLDNTLIIFTSDHGEMMGSHFMRGKSVLYEEATRIPMIMSFPGEIPPKTVVDEPVGHLDVFSTILDYLGASGHDKSDGSSLRRFIEAKSYNKEFDEAIVVTELDERIPGKSSKSGKLEPELGWDPNFMIRKGDYVLIITKKADSPNIDMMYNLKDDPFEENNLIGVNGNNAKSSVIGKAEHLKILLVEWMARKDGTLHYYSDPKWNDNAGKGDIWEITNRRTWSSLDYWQSDSVLRFGKPALVKGAFLRFEYFYVGRSTLGVLKVSVIEILGRSKPYFEIKGPTKKTIKSGDYLRIQVVFSSRFPVDEIGSVDAYMRIVANGQEQIVPFII